jgi:hypothetical protein
MDSVRIIMALAILVVAVVVALSPRVVYAPQPRVVLYFLMSVLVAILLGAEAMAQLELKLPGFVLISSGAAAVCFAMLSLLNHLSKPEEKIAVFYIYDEHGQPVDLQWKGAIEVPLTPQGLQVTKLVSENAVLLIFPEQVGQTEIRLRKSADGRQYTGPVSYAGSRSGRLRLGHDYTLNQA